MAQTTAALAGEVSTGSHQSDSAFLLQVCRPGLWTTTALFYLMPLGHSINFSSARFWVGLVYVLIPLGFVLYGVNDIFDVGSGPAEPAQGHIFVRLTRAEGTISRVAMADCGAADSVCDGISGVDRPASFSLVWRAPVGRGESDLKHVRHLTC